MTINEIIYILVLFLLLNIILIVDNKINKKCECKKNYSINSIKTPLIFTILLYIIFKLFESNIYEHFNGFSPIKQDIITDMADF